MVRLEVNKGISDYTIKGNGADVVSEITVAMCTLEEILVKELKINKNLAPALLIEAYRKASNMVGGNYND